MAESSQFDFLSEYVLKVLADNGLANLTEQQRDMYVPGITAQLERRIGYHMMPLLSEENLDRFAALVDNEKATAEEWKSFWYESVADFEGELAKVFEEFAKDVKEMLGK